ncbi:MAG: hypothetical protein SW833_04220 [Cyanobacteriota bacterium]|nr:hypothetical protein [Cyanobacteriota bacterium]
MLFILIEDLGPITLGKTCRYCSKCELIMAHQDELERELTFSVQKIAPETVGNEYFVVGTFDKKVWKRGLQSGSTSSSEVFDHLADFKEMLDLQVEPGGWYQE